MSIFSYEVGQKLAEYSLFCREGKFCLVSYKSLFKHSYIISLQTLIFYLCHGAWFCSQEIKGNFAIAFNQSTQMEFEYLDKSYLECADPQRKKAAYLKENIFWTSVVEWGGKGSLTSLNLAFHKRYFGVFPILCFSQ